MLNCGDVRWERETSKRQPGVEGQSLASPCEKGCYYMIACVNALSNEDVVIKVIGITVAKQINYNRLNNKC